MRPEINIRAVLSDADNTLVGNDSREMPSVRVTSALRRAGQYVPTGLMTARQPQKAMPLIRHLEMTGLSAFSNGAQIYDAKKEQMVLERIIDPLAVITIATELKKLGIPPSTVL